MATYLDLVNKVIQESGSEMDELNSGNWDSAEAGRRIYPRIKRNVRDAWKKIQMKRDSWEFMTGKLSTMVYPRIRFENGNRPTNPAVGDTYAGNTSGALVIIQDVVIDSGDFSIGDAVGQIDLATLTNVRPIAGETFTEVTPTVGVGTFSYLDKGDYSFVDINPDIADIHWTTFGSAVGTNSFVPMYYIPWDSWDFQDYYFMTHSVSGPSYLTQNYRGNVVFYPHSFTPFWVSFIYTRKPQILVESTDVPSRIPEEFHDWIAWEALMLFAKYDKNPVLFKYAADEAMAYMLRAEKKFMPLMHFSPSRFR